MDIAVLAEQVMSLVTPVLPALVDKGQELARKVIAQVGDTLWNNAQQIWTKLSSKVVEKPGATQIVEELAKNPNSELYQQMLTAVITSVLKENPQLVDAIVPLMEQGVKVNVVRADNRSIAVGGNVHGGNFITGDGAKAPGSKDD